MRSSLECTTDDPELMNTIALLKREEEQDTLGTLPVRGKLTHYRALFTLEVSS